MRSSFRSFLLGLSILLSAGAMAQFPYTLIVQGTVAGCTPFQQVIVTTTGSTSPSVSYTLEIFPPNCTYDTVIQLNSTYAGVMVHTLCNGQVVTASDSTTFNFINDTAVIVIDLNCTGGLPDCLGIPNGPNQPGTPCNDNDPNTINDLWSPSCACIGVALPPSSVFVTGTVSPCNGGTYPVHIFTDPGTTPTIDTLITTGPNCTYGFLFNPVNTSGWVNVEISCDSGLTWQWDSLGFTSTPGDTLLINFTCGGLITDCTGIPNGPNMPGTPCSDNNPNTINDTWSPACMCIGTPLPPTCQASFTISNSSPWVMNLDNTSTGMAPMLYDWYLPDGSSSAQNSPYFVFTTPGTYDVCLTIVTWDNCTSTLCDTVYVDSTGTVSMQPGYFDCYGTPNGSNLPGTPCQIPGTILFGTWDLNCVCDTTTLSMYDCTGILNGPNMPGTACVDTVGGVLVPGIWQANCLCVSNTTLDCLGIPGGPNMPGTACNDGDSLTVQDVWTPTCQCVGVTINYYDCVGQLNGPELPGTPCDDGDPLTINDTWSANCICVGGNTTPCQADFWVLQGFTVDSLNNPSPIPYELWVWNLSSGGSGTYSFLWNFGDGSSSTAAFPTHTYAGNGPYLLCLTIDDGAGCVSTSCDSVSIDNNGLYTGIMGGGNDRQNGFTINVQDPLSSGVGEALDLDGIAAWPNPVVDELNIALTSAVRGTADVTVLDLSGRVVLGERRTLSDGRNQLLLQTSTLTPGLYTVRISNGNASISQRFVKAN